MRKLLLVRHAQSQLTPGIAPSVWTLTNEGRTRAAQFASLLDEWQPAIIITSEEPKALATGEILGKALNVPVRPHPGLFEHRRPAFETPFSEEEFVLKVEQLFDKPDELVFGEETGNEALERFESGIREVLEQTEGNVAVVSHGTVMALFVAKYNPVDVKAFWRSLAMPDLVILDAFDAKLLRGSMPST